MSNVLLGRHDIVAPEKRDMVLQAARELEYIPVRPTLQNRHVETRVIAVPFDEPRKISWSINSGTYSGICEKAMECGYDVLMLLRSDPDWVVERSEFQFLDKRSDGIIFASPIIGETQHTFEALARHNIPTVVCYRRDLPEELVWVDVDNQGAMRGSVKHLVEMGHRRIVHLTLADKSSFDKRVRRDFFSEAMREFGLFEWAEGFVETEFFAADEELVRKVVAMGATGIVAMNDLLAIDFIKAAEQAGVSIPNDLSIIGVDGVDAPNYDLTSMEFSFEDIGLNATEALVDRMKGLPVEDCCREIPVQLVQRGSVRNLNGF